MKPIVSLFSFVLLFQSCGEVNGKEMAKEVCECAERANNISKPGEGNNKFNEFNRYEEFEECWDLMDEYEELLKKYPKEQENYEACFPCLDTVVL